MTNLEIQTLNYWQACQWLSDDDQIRQSHARAILMAIANCPDLGVLSDNSRRMLIYNKKMAEMNIWMGTRQ